MDIVTTRAAAPRATRPLTSTLRAHLLAQYRTDLRHDLTERDYLIRTARLGGRTDKRRTHRIGALTLRIEATADAIAELEEHL